MVNLQHFLLARLVAVGFELPGQRGVAAEHRLDGLKVFCQLSFRVPAVELGLPYLVTVLSKSTRALTHVTACCVEKGGINQFQPYRAFPLRKGVTHMTSKALWG